MTALAAALAYLGTLAFLASMLRRRDAYREDVTDRVRTLASQVERMESRVKDWDAAATYVEAQGLAKGMRR